MMDKTLTTAPPLAWAVQLSLGKAKPAATVEPAVKADTARQDGHAPQGDGGATTPGSLLAPAPADLSDPNAPTGPPPAFKANVLDAERARLSRPAGLEGQGRPQAVAAYDQGAAAAAPGRFSLVF